MDSPPDAGWVPPTPHAETSAVPVSRDQVFHRAVDLVMAEDRLIHGWIGRYIGVQGAVAAIIAAILGWSNQYDGWIVTALTLLAGLGILFALTISSMITRSVEWRRACVRAAREAEGGGPILFRDEKSRRGPRVDTAIQRVTWGVVFLWIAFATAIIWTYIKSGGGDEAGSVASLF